jgi:hypothetical protein
MWGTDLQEARMWVADLQQARLEGANLQGARMWVVQLQGANLWGAHLQGATLWGADLRGANLAAASLQETILDGADLREVSLDGANLQGAILVRADLRQVNLLECGNLEGVHLHRAALDHTQLSQEQIGQTVGEERDREYDKARETYRALKVNFIEIGRYKDAAWAYVRERKMERAALWPSRAAEYYGGVWWSEASSWRRGCFYLACFGKWAWAGVIDVVTGYGQQVSNVLGTSAFIMVLWSALYWFSGGIGRDHRPRSFCWQDFHRCWAHSVATFATLSYGDLEPKTSTARWLTTMEALLGIGMLALLMFVIGNRAGSI